MDAGGKNQEDKGIIKQSQISDWHLPLLPLSRYHMVSVAEGTMDSASTTTRRVGAAVSSSCFQGWDLSWMDGVSVLAGSDLWDMALQHPHISILHLCQEPIPSLVCPQPKNQVGATSKEETECGWGWRKMDSTGDQNSGAEPISNNKQFSLPKPPLVKWLPPGSPKRSDFFWDDMVRPCVDMGHWGPEASSQVSPTTWTEISSSMCWGRFQHFISKAMPAESRFLFHVWGSCYFLVAVDGDGENNSISLQNVFIVMSTKYFLPPQTVEVLSIQHPSSFGKHFKTTNRISLFLFLAP